MMNKDELAKQFEGGTVYQAFLSALSYHRWHAPVSGTIKKAFVVDGTFFSEKLEAAIINTNDAEKSKAGLTSSQSYIAHMATRFVTSCSIDFFTRAIGLTYVYHRAVIFMEADNPDIGLMCFIGIGMDEVSTCDITVKEGKAFRRHGNGNEVSLTLLSGTHVKKGECTGMFHFGGSSVRIFRGNLMILRTDTYPAHTYLPRGRQRRRLPRGWPSPEHTCPLQAGHRFQVNQLLCFGLLGHFEYEIMSISHEKALLLITFFYQLVVVHCIVCLGIYISLVTAKTSMCCATQYCSPCAKIGSDFATTSTWRIISRRDWVATRKARGRILRGVSFQHFNQWMLAVSGIVLLFALMISFCVPLIY